ncbi:hypothetical protein BE15_29260 [Sorangium cellulosum]|uniref:Uncharacterized protein n=1 Tax=Sorangium cellulosum TaxID=56 RepID=A0A150Q333_SORCE|nr:hypothetical protein BE15_29260 [Sorangium cellulosum]
MDFRGGSGRACRARSHPVRLCSHVFDAAVGSGVPLRRERVGREASCLAVGGGAGLRAGRLREAVSIAGQATRRL